MDVWDEVRHGPSQSMLLAEPHPSSYQRCAIRAFEEPWGSAHGERTHFKARFRRGEAIDWFESCLEESIWKKSKLIWKWMKLNEWKWMETRRRSWNCRRNAHYAITETITTPLRRIDSACTYATLDGSFSAKSKRKSGREVSCLSMAISTHWFTNLDKLPDVKSADGAQKTSLYLIKK